MSTSPSILYRQLNANGDPIWGQGQANFLADQPAVAQAILTRLRLFEGEWWASLTDGLPLWQSILGQSASQAQQDEISAIISARILGTPFVLGISSLATSFNAQTRGPYTYSAVVATQFGQIIISNMPTPPSGALPL